jgi:hypothetical protein
MPEPRQTQIIADEIERSIVGGVGMPTVANWLMLMARELVDLETRVIYLELADARREIADKKIVYEYA